MKDDDLKLYSFRRCPFAMRARLTLNEKGLPFTVVEEDLKNFSPELRALHPEAKVPVLVHGKTVVYESAIIVEYLEDQFPSAPLMPKSPGERASVRLWGYWCNHHFKPDVDRLKYGTSRFSEAECVGVEQKLATHLAKLENRLQTHAWLAAEAYSLADILVFPFARQLVRVRPTPAFLVDYPKFLQWVSTIEARPAFEKTAAR